jgi:hypothetical protein
VSDRSFERIGALSAAAVAGLSVLYAVAYLVITPSAQRGSDAGELARSYLAHPAGLRIASACLAVSGVLSGLAIVAVVGRLGPAGGRALRYAAVAGPAAGLATAAHGLSDLVGVDRLAHRYASGGGAERAAIAVAHDLPSPVDPRGLATFGVAGLVALVLGLALGPVHPRLGAVGTVLGMDLVALFLATAAGLDALVLVTGALASVVLGPCWWAGLARMLWSAERRSEPAPAGAARSPLSPVRRPGLG